MHRASEIEEQYRHHILRVKVIVLFAPYVDIHVHATIFWRGFNSAKWPE